MKKELKKIISICFSLFIYFSAYCQYYPFGTTSRNVTHWRNPPNSGTTHTQDLSLTLNDNVPGSESLNAIYLGGKQHYIGNTTGYFTTKKDDKNVWHLVDPDGYDFFSIGVNDVNINKNPTAIQADALVDDLKSSYSINTLGNWTDQTELRKMPYTYKINVIGDYCRSIISSRRSHLLYTGHILPILGSDTSIFTGFLSSYLDTLIKSSDISDKKLLGYFSDNELELGITGGKSMLTRYTDINNYSDLGSDDPTYKATNDWITNNITPVIVNGKPTYSPDDEEKFIAYVADIYYKNCRNALKAKDSNHLYIGTRMNRDLNGELLFGVAAKYLDVISINCYGQWTVADNTSKIWSNNGEKPFIISEFYASADNLGSLNNAGAGFVVANQKDRSTFYENFTLNLLNKKDCVGYHWYRYMDLKETTKQQNNGLYQYNADSSFIPTNAYDSLKVSFKKINKNIYNLRNWILFGTPLGSVDKDAYVRAGSFADNNFGTKTSMSAKETTDPFYRRRGMILLKIDNSITSSSQLESAKLKLYCDTLTNTASTVTVSLYAIPSSWYQTTVTYNTAPTRVQTEALDPNYLIASQTISAVNHYYEWNITQDIKSIIDSGYHTRSYMIVAKSASGAVVSFNTFEAVTNKPVFEINSYSYNGINGIQPNNSIELNIQKKSNIIYPNPVNDILNISLNRDTKINTLEIIDLNGRTLRKFNNTVAGSVNEINVSFLNPGVYFLKITDSNFKTEAVKFIKE